MCANHLTSQQRPLARCRSLTLLEVNNEIYMCICTAFAHAQMTGTFVEKWIPALLPFRITPQFWTTPSRLCVCVCACVYFRVCVCVCVIPYIPVCPPPLSWLGFGRRGHETVGEWSPGGASSRVKLMWPRGTTRRPGPGCPVAHLPPSLPKVRKPRMPKGGLDPLRCMMAASQQALKSLSAH